VKTTRNPESAVARTLKSQPRVVSESGSKSIDCPVFAIVNVCEIEAAAL